MSSSTPAQGSSRTTRPPSYDDIRQQAGPLPSKRGEIGFVEGVHTQGQQETNIITLPARHPADRDEDSPTVAVPLTPTPSAAVAGESTQATGGPNPTPSTPADPAAKQHIILKFLKPKKNPAFRGLRLSTLLAFVAQFLVLSACIVGWVFTGIKIGTMAKDGGGNMPGGVSSTIFVHAVFCVAVIGQLIFLERRVYRLRAERYSYLHPGEMLPRYSDRAQPGGDLSFAFAPWNRPPLPTYAAVLVQSGHGTGDVDDHLIAVPPPPAYGNTRGSTLLLSGFLRNSLRAQRPPSVQSEQDLERGEGVATAGPVPNRDSHLQQTLAQLEGPQR